MYQILEGHTAPLSELGRDLPQNVIHAVEKAMSPEPAQRHASVGDFIEALLGAGSSPLTVTSTTERLVKRAERLADGSAAIANRMTNPRSTKLVPLVLVAVGLVAMILVGWMRATPEPGDPHPKASVSTDAPALASPVPQKSSFGLAGRSGEPPAPISAAIHSEGSSTPTRDPTAGAEAVKAGPSQPAVQAQPVPRAQRKPVEEQNPVQFERSNPYR